MITWHILTGEYPPQPGGVSDYSRLLATSLTQAGDTVNVWAPPASGEQFYDPGVNVHRLADCYGPRSLAALELAFKHKCPNRRIFVQYVPHAFGCKAMNLPFCYWLYGQRHREHIWTMFHEVVYPISPRQSLRHNFLGCVTRLMASLVSRASERCFVSTQAWSRIIQRKRHCPPIEWLPIPSNIPTEVDEQTRLALRLRYGASPDDLLVGHFGTFGGHIASMIEPVIPLIMAGSKNRICLLLGRRGDQFLPRLIDRYPHLVGRIFACGSLPAMELATHLAACDVLIQPYMDGVTTRRGSLMAGLALGVPIVTTTGRLTEPFWQTDRLVALAPTNSPEAIALEVEGILEDASARQALGRRGREAYRQLFSVERTIERLKLPPRGCNLANRCAEAARPRGSLREISSSSPPPNKATAIL